MIEKAKIWIRLKIYAGVLRCGAFYSGRVDEMHTELNVGDPTSGARGEGRAAADAAASAAAGARGEPGAAGGDPLVNHPLLVGAALGAMGVVAVHVGGWILGAWLADRAADR
jgi:hypothetical protein